MSNELKEKLLLEFLENEPGESELYEIEITGYNEYYGGDVIELSNGTSWLVLNEDERYEIAKNSILSTVVYFNASFLGEVADLDYRVFEVLSLSDDNDAMLKLLERLDVLDEVVDLAIENDGYGHFISSYDGVEHEYKNYFIYRDY